MIVFLDICNGHVDTKVKYTILFLAAQKYVSALICQKYIDHICLKYKSLMTKVKEP